MTNLFHEFVYLFEHIIRISFFLKIFKEFYILSQ